MTAIMTAEAERAISDHQNKPLDDLQKIEATMALHRERRKDEVRRMQVRFERWLPVLLSSRAGRVAKQLERSIPMALCRDFIAEHLEEILAQRSPLDRFLDGELTAGVKPIYISKMNAVDVGHLQETARIIDTMAAKLDAGEWRPPTMLDRARASMDPAAYELEMNNFPIPGVAMDDVDAEVDPMKSEDLAAAADKLGMSVEDGKVIKNGEQIGVIATTVTPAQQAKLDSKVSALPPAMPRHARRRR